MTAATKGSPHPGTHPALRTPRSCAVFPTPPVTFFPFATGENRLQSFKAQPIPPSQLQAGRITPLGVHNFGSITLPNCLLPLALPAESHSLLKLPTLPQTQDPLFLSVREHLHLPGADMQQHPPPICACSELIVSPKCLLHLPLYLSYCWRRLLFLSQDYCFCFFTKLLTSAFPSLMLPRKH